MPTANITITSAWTKVADASNESVLVTWEAPSALEVATTATDIAPTVTGHRLSPDSAISRQALGNGFVWAKTVSGAYATNIKVVVTK